MWLDAPTGKSFHCRLEDGWPNFASFLRQEIWVSYFSCMPKHGIFVKADKLILDKRDRDLHSYRSKEELKIRAYELGREMASSPSGA